MRYTKHNSRHRFSYPISLGERVYSTLVGPLLAVALTVIALKLLSFSPVGNFSGISFNDLITATGLTLYRLFVAYILAVALAIPLALFATSSDVTEKIFLPAFDILESVPILAFFPVILLFFIRFGYLNGAAIFMLFLVMLWNIVFTVVGGLKVIPQDIVYAAFVFKIRGWNYIRQVIFPAIVPQIVVGSILAMAQGWNFIIVAEVMHVYIPNGTSAQDLFGLGSILVKAASRGQTDLFIVSITMMVFIIALINFFVWQKLLHYVQIFRFE